MFQVNTHPPTLPPTGAFTATRTVESAGVHPCRITSSCHQRRRRRPGSGARLRAHRTRKSRGGLHSARHAEHRVAVRHRPCPGLARLTRVACAPVDEASGPAGLGIHGCDRRGFARRQRSGSRRLLRDRDRDCARRVPAGLASHRDSRLTTTSTALRQDVFAREPPIGERPEDHDVAELQQRVLPERRPLDGLAQQVGEVQPVVAEEPRMQPLGLRE